MKGQGRATGLQILEVKAGDCRVKAILTVS